MYRKWKVILNDSGLGPAPDPEDYPRILNDTYRWLANREYEELLPYGAMVYEDLSDVYLKYKVLAATRYGGWEMRSVDNDDPAELEYLFLDIDRRGNLINTVHNTFCNLSLPYNFFLPPPSHSFILIFSGGSGISQYQQLGAAKDHHLLPGFPSVHDLHI